MGGAAEPPQHRPGVRPRGGGRLAVHRHGVRAGDQLPGHRHHRPRAQGADPPQRGGGVDDPGLRRGPCRARADRSPGPAARARPPGHLTPEPDGDRRRAREVAGLRDCQGDGAGRRDDARRGPEGQGPLHVPRAGAPAAPGPPQRRVRTRHRGVGAADAAPAVQAREREGHHAGHHRRHLAPAGAGAATARSRPCPEAWRCRTARAGRPPRSRTG